MKYELLKNEPLYCGTHTLYKIKALKDFADVKKGDVGGYVEYESNLSQEGDCWIYDEAVVAGKSIVKEDATVRDSAVVVDSNIYGRAIVQQSSEIIDSDIYGRANIAYKTSGNPKQRIVIECKKICRGFYINELMIRALVMDGLTKKQIADFLRICTRTVLRTMDKYSIDRKLLVWETNGRPRKI